MAAVSLIRGPLSAVNRVIVCSDRLSHLTLAGLIAALLPATGWGRLFVHSTRNRCRRPVAAIDIASLCSSHVRTM